MKILRYLKQRFGRRTSTPQERYFSDVNDFSLDRWEKCQKGNIRFVNYDNESTKKDGERWVSLFNQYLEIFGIDPGLSEFLDVKIFISKLRYQYIISGDKSLLNQIEIEKVNLQNLDPSKHEGMTTDQCIVHLSKWLGYHVRKKDITIVEFKNLMNEYVRGNK